MNNDDAIKWLVAIKEKYIHGGDETFDEMRKEAIDTAIHSLNTQESLEKKIEFLASERPQGEWIECGESLYTCSVCGIVSCCKGNFCSECGAKM